MPRKHTVRDYQPDSFYHLYNICANDFPIFHDDEDFNTFEGYLLDYLTPPASKDDLKVTVEFKGKQLTGVPRQPNNYCDQLSLTSYCLTPTEFHLLVYQMPSHAIAKFMQSINTRYSMYFNKRHGRTGSPFQGKYKSFHVENEADIMLLTKFIHRKSWRDDGRCRSSYPDYLGQEQTDWVNTQRLRDFYVTQVLPEQNGRNQTPEELIKEFTETDIFDLNQELGEMRLDY